MSDDGDNVVSFRRPDGPSVPPPPPPPLPPAPRPRPPVALPPVAMPSPAGAVGEGPVSGAWPRLPAVAQMRPPLAVPDAPPAPEPAADEDANADADVFTPPGPEDPDNPTVRDTLAVAVALLTALGVAAAQAMWQRARHRQARADQARAAADRAGGKTASGSGGSGSGGGRAAKGSSKSPSLPRSPGGSQKGSRTPGGPKGRGGGNKPPGGGKGSGGPSGSRKGRPDGKGGPGSKAPKAGPGGKRKDEGKPGRKRDGADKGDVGKRLRRGVEKLKRAKDAAGKGAPGSKRPGGRGRRLTWKAPKSGSGEAGRKRWARTGKDGSSKRRSGFRGGFRSGVAWLKRWRASRTGADETPSTTTASEETAEETETTAETFEAAAEETGTPKPPPPRPGFGGMRPPPGADRRTWVTVERVDGRARPRPEAAALTVGQAALPAGTADAPAADTPPPPPPAPQEGPLFVSTPTRTPQYTAGGDVDLSIYDVIEADEDMAAEITDGVGDAVVAAEGCEVLLARLEELHATVVELQVPGSLAGMVLQLMEQAATVKARAEAIAEKLPAAAEAIAVAGANAEARHQGLADAVRDAGHARPAERDYHND